MHRFIGESREGTEAAAEARRPQHFLLIAQNALHGQSR